MLTTIVINYGETDCFTYHVSCEKPIILPEERVEEFKEVYNLKVLEIVEHNEAIMNSIKSKQESIRTNNISYKDKCEIIYEIGRLHEQLIYRGSSEVYNRVDPLEIIKIVLEEMDCQKYQESMKHFHLDEETAFIE